MVNTPIFLQVSIFFRDFVPQEMWEKSGLLVSHTTGPSTPINLLGNPPLRAWHNGSLVFQLIGWGGVPHLIQCSMNH